MTIKTTLTSNPLNLLITIPMNKNILMERNTRMFKKTFPLNNFPKETKKDKTNIGTAKSNNVLRFSPLNFEKHKRRDAAPTMIPKP